MEQGAHPRGADRLQVDEEAASSSPSNLSTPPRSPSDSAHPATSNAAVSRDNFGVANNRVETLHTSTSATSSTKNNPSTTTAGPAAKKPRKKREPKVPAAGDDKPKEKKPRKPREPKDPNAPQGSRKKAKLSDPVHDEKLAQAANTISRQPKITDLVHGNITVTQPQHSLHNSQAMPSPSIIVRSNPDPNISHLVAPSSLPTTPRPASSGQHFDPIRSTNIHVVPSSVPAANSPTNMHRASASPAISGLMNPIPVPAPAQNRIVPSNPATPAPVSPAVTTRPNPPLVPSSAILASNASAYQANSLIRETEVDSRPAATQMNPPEPTTTGSAAHTPPPKPRKQEAPAPMPTGSGLLSALSLNGPTSAPADASKGEGVNIWLTFPVKGQTNVTINYAREVERKYGFAALHPRIAAKNERRRQMAAAAAALEKSAGKESGDEMSLDHSEPDTDAEMG
ncbi:hypothetical protein LTS18_010973, partial [Coniosporium uncinatum]